MSVDSILSALYKERARIDAAIRALESISTGKRGSSGSGSGSAKRRGRVLSADARKRISEAQRKRWANQKAGK
jgi:hypothetical protein